MGGLVLQLMAVVKMWVCPAGATVAVPHPDSLGHRWTYQVIQGDGLGACTMHPSRHMGK